MRVADENFEDEYMNMEERIEAQFTMKIGIFKPAELSDMLCIIPSVRALRNCYPNASIILMGEAASEELVDRFSGYFDQFIPFSGFNENPDDFNTPALLEFIAKGRAEAFDLVLQLMDEVPSANRLTELLNPKFLAGFYQEGEYFLDNGLFLPYPKGLPEVERYLALLENINVEAVGTELEFPITDCDWDQLQQLHLPLALESYVCIHITGTKESNWPPEYFAILGNYAVSHGFEVVIAGSEKDLPIAVQVANIMHTAPIVLAGKVSLGGMAALMKNSHAVICNCTNISLLAAALKKPSIVVSTDAAGCKKVPANKMLHTTINWHENPDLELVLSKIESLFLRKATVKAA